MTGCLCFLLARLLKLVKRTLSYKRERKENYSFAIKLTILVHQTLHCLGVVGSVRLVLGARYSVRCTSRCSLFHANLQRNWHRFRFPCCAGVLWVDIFGVVGWGWRWRQALTPYMCGTHVWNLAAFSVQHNFLLATSSTSRLPIIPSTNKTTFCKSCSSHFYIHWHFCLCLLESLILWCWLRVEVRMVCLCCFSFARLPQTSIRLFYIFLHPECVF